MALSDVVGASGTTSFAQIGFIISFVVFSLIVIWALTRSRASMATVASSVLSDGQVVRRVGTPRGEDHGQ